MTSPIFPTLMTCKIAIYSASGPISAICCSDGLIEMPTNFLISFTLSSTSNSICEDFYIGSWYDIKCRIYLQSSSPPFCNCIALKPSVLLTMMLLLLNIFSFSLLKQVAQTLYPTEFSFRQREGVD